MVLPAHNRITFSGVFGTVAAPIEIWSFRLCTGPETFASDADRATRAATIADMYDSHLKSLYTSNMSLTRVRVSEHVEGGATKVESDGSYAQGDWVGDKYGTSTGGVEMPLQTALVASLVTARAGATGKGRIFLPFPATLLDGASQVPAGFVTTFGTAVRDLLNDINSILTSDPTLNKVSVVSSKGYRSLVTGVAVGSRPDTMRSRVNQIPEGTKTVLPVTA